MTDDASEAVAAYFHASRSQGKRRKPNPVAAAILERAGKKLSERFLYFLNTETGDKTGHVDISDMKPMEINAAEARMWAQIEGEVYVVRDSALD